jgi:hypothetical protein
MGKTGIGRRQPRRQSSQVTKSTEQSRHAVEPPYVNMTGCNEGSVPVTNILFMCATRTRLSPIQFPYSGRGKCRRRLRATSGPWRKCRTQFIFGNIPSHLPTHCDVMQYAGHSFEP